MAGALPGLLASPLAAKARVMQIGVNLIEDPAAPFGSARARQSFANLAEAGATTVALVPFFWQPGASDPALVRGSALPRDRLFLGIKEAARVGLDVLVKPHVWVPERWAGSVVFSSEGDWQSWFDAYATALIDCAETAAEAGADVLSIGTELLQTSARPEWTRLIARAREVFPGRLTYVAHNSAEAQQVGFWNLLDIVTMSSYPSLGAPTDMTSWRRAINGEIGALRALADRHAKPAWLGEIGIRSAADATYKPWESAEERDAAPDPALQARVLRLWLDAAQQGGIDTALVWRWLSDPQGGGPEDTDFTIQNKPAQSLLRRR
ncbi:hypothetical protein N6L26_08275 [Qipengyuania sp. SS22]|uniref:glycoside hydrolase family 113 n=1 Tax=Qipengyuania sp. SS22 TaxID=2979461 RepID=UPI0021E53B84|nr:hypothetical protein [Qipengyuania sp. SS22]UYH54063.1 hypothetical protein N6L26_08275 [Qipengyuania sp. SS22]